MGGEVEQKVSFRASCNRIFCVPSFIQGWGTQGESKISFFPSLILINQKRNGVEFKIVLIASAKSQTARPTGTSHHPTFGLDLST